jgi:hypothetical protein
MEQKQEQEQEQKQIDYICMIYALAQGNPGAHTVVAKMLKLIEEDDSKNTEIMEFISKLLDNDITGSRLWYIFKNEANSDINKLINIDLSQFTNKYFFEKFEKYTL